MEVIQKVARMRAIAAELREAGKRVGFVPTMGYLHEGHLSLVRKCQELVDINPKQFGPSEDFESYPRDFVRDADVLSKEGDALIFNPSPAEMYPQPYSTYVQVEGISEVLEGAKRPGHFRGVCTVVLKLLQIVQPHVAVFGQKDAQQVAVLEQMARDLNVPTEIVHAPTVREPDGLAMSSRNTYLDPEERRAAVTIYRALRAGQKRAEEEGETSTAKIRGVALETIHEEPLIREVEYVATVDPRTFREIRKVTDTPVLLVTAVRIGETRLIDNILINEGRRTKEP